MPKLSVPYRLIVSMSRQQKRVVILTGDVVLIAVAYMMARALIITDGTAWNYTYAVGTDLAALLLIGTTAIVLLGLHKIKLNAYQMQGVVEAAFAAPRIMMHPSEAGHARAIERAQGLRLPT